MDKGFDVTRETGSEGDLALLIIALQGLPEDIVYKFLKTKGALAGTDEKKE